MEKRYFIAQRAASFIEDGDFVNLGVGIPTLCANYIKPGISVTLHSENGIVGMGPPPENDDSADRDIVDAGANPATIVQGGYCCDLATSFAIMRGGHLDKTIIGALQVDRHGSFASWKIPGKVTYGMGGAMDLAAGAKMLIVAMEHCCKDGTSKILGNCTYPITAERRINYIVTELCIFKCDKDELVLIELAPGVSLNTVIDKTGTEIAIPDNFANKKTI